MSALIMSALASSTMLMLPLMTQPLSLGLVMMFSTLLMCSISVMLISSW